MYSAYKLNKRGDNIQPWYTVFVTWNRSVVPCLVLTFFLTCLRISQEADWVICYSHLFRIFQFVVVHTVKGFGIVNAAEVDVSLKFSCSFYDSADVGNLISGSSAFLKSSLNIWNFSGHLLLKPNLKNFENYLVSMWNEWNCVVVWTFICIASLWDWNENWPFPVISKTDLLVIINYF